MQIYTKILKLTLYHRDPWQVVIRRCDVGQHQGQLLDRRLLELLDVKFGKKSLLTDTRKGETEGRSVPRCPANTTSS